MNILYNVKSTGGVAKCFLYLRQPNFTIFHKNYIKKGIQKVRNALNTNNYPPPPPLHYIIII